MRILKLEFENLNSLKGHWSIDFTHPDYKKNHDIFVIHGPTGAGKTTILDAITLALYARTPRQSAVNDGSAGNELMSRGCGICYSRVTYRCRSGVYVSEFQQNRANSRPSGRLQKPSYKITKVDDADFSAPPENQAEKSGQENQGEFDFFGADDKNRVIASGTASSLGAETQKIIQLDYNQFCRSIMLAQGEFNKFLTSDERERADILEKLTGTEKYRGIAQKICQKYSEVKRAFNEKKDAREEIRAQLLSEDDEKAAMRSVAELEKKIAANEGKLDEARGALAFFDELDRLFGERESARNEKTAVEKESADFADDERRLLRAQAARNCEADFAELTSLRNSQKSDENQIEELSKRIFLAQSNYAQSEQNAQDAKKQLADEETIFAQQQEIWKKVRALDVQIKNARDREKESAERKNSAEQDARNAEEKINSLTSALAQLEKTSRASQDYLAQNKDDERLPAVIAKIDAMQNSLKAQDKALDDLQSKKSGILQKCAEAQNELSRAKDALQTLEDEMRRFVAEDAVNIARILRRQLAPGNPCPVCGGVYHPGNCDAADDKALDGKAQGIAQTSTNLTAQYDNLTVRIQNLTAGHAALESERRATEENLSAAFGARAEEIARISQELLPWQKNLPQEITARQISDILADLQEKSGEWSRQNDALQEARTQQTALDAELAAIRKSADSLAEAVEKSRAEHKSCQSELDALCAERGELFGEKDPDAEEKSKNQRMESLRNQREAAQSAQNAANEEKTRLEAQKIQLDKAVQERLGAIKTAQDNFAKKCGSNGFEDEADFSAARLPEDALAALSEKSEALKIQRTQADTTLKNAEKSYEDFKSSANISGKKEDFLLEQENLAQEKIRLGNEIVAVRSRLEANEQTKNRAKKIEDDFNALRQEHETWEQMKKWVGKDDGSDLSVFVQSLAFSRLLDITNQHLFDITRRYKVVQKSALSLAFEICDVYFPENRSIKTLSGGEQFLVSLSFALGISRFVSRNVSVDSLFLDEGFGTLSGELLDEAIAALKNLRKEGKMLGIITHVQEVIDEIDQRIEVRPATGGYSVLSGSGIRRL